MSAKLSKKQARKADANKRRKGLLAFLFPWVKRFGVFAGVAVALIWAGAYMYVTSAHLKALDWAEDRAMQALADAGFAVENVLVEGREQSDAAVLLALIDVQKGDPLFSVSPRDIKNRVEQMEWVQRAHVERRLPDTIYIRLFERQPLAFWQKDSDLFLIDAKGEIIHTDKLGRFSGLVLLTGDGAPAQAAALLDMLEQQPILHERVQAAAWLGARRWDMQIKSGAVVKLPETETQEALALLAEAQAEESLLDKDIQSIDLREPGRIIIRTKPGESRAYFKKQEVSLHQPGNDI